MHVRSFQLSDYISVNELLRNALSEECYEETKGAFANQLSLDSDLVLVASDGERVTGVAIGTIDRSRGYYYRLAVHPDHRRQGIGKQLIAAMKARFENRKVRNIHVAFDQHNEHLLPLYAALGFTHSPDKLKIVNG